MHANHRERQAYLKAYAQSPEGQAARARARQNYIKRRREQAQHDRWTPDSAEVQPLEQAITNWSRT